MTLKQLNEIFKSEYPIGAIQKDYMKKTNVYNVWYTEGGKMYDYKASNLLILAKKVKIADNTWIYAHDLKEMNSTLKIKKAELQYQIDNEGKEVESLFFDEVEVVEIDKNLVADIERLEDRIANFKYIV